MLLGEALAARHNMNRREFLGGSAAIVFGLRSAFAADGPAAGNARDELYAQLVALYMNAQWDELNAELKSASAKLSTLPMARRNDIVYIRQALSECHPAWWKDVKADRQTTFSQQVFGQALRITFDPNAQPGVNMNQVGSERRLTVSWRAADMDSPEHAEHSYTKGDLANLGVWQAMGMARVWQNLPVQVLINPTEADKKRLQFVFDYWAAVAALYYCSPPARHWALWLDLAAFEEKYRKALFAGPRRVIAELFLTEVLNSPDSYPSVSLPEQPLGEPLLENLALHCKKQFSRSKHWTVPEEKRFRLAVKTFVTGNERAIKDSGTARLPNGLSASIDPDADAALRGRREEWIAARLLRLSARPAGRPT